METPLRYSSVEDILMMPIWDSPEKYLLQITVSDGFYLLQVSKIVFPLFFVEAAIYGIQVTWDKF